MIKNWLSLFIILFFSIATSRASVSLLEANVAIPIPFPSCHHCSANYGALVGFGKESRISYIGGIQASFFQNSRMEKEGDRFVRTSHIEVKGTELFGGIKYLLEDKKQKTFFTLYSGKGWGKGNFEKRTLREHGNVQFTTLNVGLSVHWPFNNYPSTGVNLGITETLTYFDDTSDFPKFADRKRFIVNIPSLVLGMYAEI